MFTGQSPSSAKGVDASPLHDELNQALLTLLRQALVIALIANVVLGTTDILFEPVHDMRIAALRIALVAAVIALFFVTYTQKAVRWAVQISFLALAVGCIQNAGPPVMHGQLETPIVLSIALAAAISTAAPWGVRGQLIALAVMSLTTIGTIAILTGDMRVALGSYPPAATGIVFVSSLWAASICRRNNTLSIERGIALRRSTKLLETREAQIRDQLVQLDTLYRTAPVGLSLLDPELRYVRINDTLAEMNGAPAADHIGRTLRDLLPELADDLETLYAEIFSTGQAVLQREITGTTARQPGVTRHWRAGYSPMKDAQGRVIAVGCVVQEVTEQRQAQQALAQLNADLERRVSERTEQLQAANARLEQEIGERREMAEALRRSQQQLRDILDNATAVIYLKDTAGRYLLINSRYETLFRVSREQVIGQSDLDLFPRDTAEALRSNDRQVLSVDHALSFEEMLPHDDGIHTYLSVKFPLHDERGAPYGVCGISTDITDRKRAEERLRDHQAELSHVLRLHTIGEMAAGLAHEINQPLAAIANYARGCRNRIVSGDAPADELLPVLGEITTQALRCGEIIRRLRSMVEKREPTRETVDINAVVTEAAHVVEGQIRQQGMTLSLDLASDLPAVEIDPIQIGQVIVNLILNSLDAMNAVDRTSGDAAVAGPGHHMIVSTMCSAGEEVEVVVEDTGIGLAPDIHAKMFEPFFTIKPTGLGMGLAISRSIVDGHGGRIWAVNNGDRGARVHVILPSANAKFS